MNDDINDRIDELVTLAALGELTEAENAELDAALAADASIAAELDADLAVAAQLQSTQRTAPPAAMKQSVLDAIAKVKQDDAPIANPPAPVPAANPPAPVPAANPPAPVPVGTQATPEQFAAPTVIGIERARRRRWQPLAAAAAVIMLLVGGVIVAGRDAGLNQFETVAEANDAVRRTLEGDLGGTLDVVWSPSADAFVLAGTDIPVLTDAETYQLWFVDTNGATPIGLFRPNDDGTVEQVYADLDPSDFVVGVTVEPAGGSDSPTLPIIAAA